jgi:hypothetical protein
MATRWMRHVQDTYRQANGRLSFKQAMKQAKRSYRGGNNAMPTQSSLGFQSLSGGRRSRRRRQSRRRR